MTIAQAVRAVEDIFFNTSNDLYDLRLPLRPFPSPAKLEQKLLSSGTSDLQTLTTFLEEHPTIKFLRVQFVDYTATSRLRVVPVKRALALLQKEGNLNVGITKAALGLLQNDMIIPGVAPIGEYRLKADFSSLCLGPSDGYASVYGDLLEANGSQASLCPRSTLQKVLEASSSQGLDYLIGFEIEIVFMSRTPDGKVSTLASSGGHAWSSPRALQDTDILSALNEIYDTLSAAGIDLEMFHPESSSGQYEFVLPPFPPLQSADTLLHTREIITAVTAKYGIRATLIPKPFPMMAGTASHVHLSIASPDGDKKEVYGPFYAGVLKHMKAIIAFTYSNPCSYDRMVDGCWAGGRWVAWGTQNKETALRKISGSHFEFKVLDGLANVYFALAAILAAGALGVKNKEKLTIGDCGKDPGLLTEKEREELGVTEMLPKDLREALRELASDDSLVEVLGKDVVERYAAVKRAEMELLAGMKEDERREWVIQRY